MQKNNLVNTWQPGISTGIFRPVGENLSDPAFSPKKHLPMLKKTGFKTIELTCYWGDLGTRDFPWQNPDNIEELAKVAQDCDITINSVHVPELRLSSQDKTNSKKLDALKRFIEISIKLNSRFMVVHYFPEKDDNYDKEMPEILMELYVLVRDKPLLVCLETLQNKEANSKLASLFKYLNPSSFGFVIDSGHCNIAGDLYDISHTFGKCIKSLHLHDNNGSHDQHFPIGKGVIDWNRFIKSLVDIQYEGPLMLEYAELLAEHELYAYLENARKDLRQITQVFSKPMGK